MRALSDATAAMLAPMRLRDTDRLKVDVDETERFFHTSVFSAPDHLGFKSGWPSEDARTGWIARVPERKQLDDGSWLLAATDYTAEIIRAVWCSDDILSNSFATNRIEWQSEKAVLIYNNLLLNTTLQDDNALVYARYKELGEIPKHTLSLHPDFPLTPYQQVMGYCALQSEGFGEFCEQGTGKTAPVISKICTHALDRTDENPYMAIIICPKNVRTNWVREFERFATVEGEINVIKGGKMSRRGQLIEAWENKQDCKYSVVVMSYATMMRDIDDLVCYPWDLAVADEAHNLARPETKQSKAALMLRDCSACRMPLTGTPMANTPLDLYMLFEFMGKGWSGFQSWKTFKDFYGVYDSPDGDSYRKLVAIQNLPFMKERLSRTSFIIRKEEALPDLPAKVYDTSEVEMSPRQEEIYNKIATELAYEIEDELDSSNNQAVTINSVLTKLLRLAQIASGYVVWDEVLNHNTMEVLKPKSIEFFNPDLKLDGLMELLQGKTPDEKTIVWSAFVPCIKMISERFTREGLQHVVFYGKTSDEERVIAEHEFNYNPDCRLLVGNPAAGGTGLNLLGYPPHAGEGVTTNCNHHIYYACDWSFIKRDQSEARSHRKGTRVPVRITDLVVPDTLDEEIRIRVLKKKMTAFELTDIREILQGVLRSMKVGHYEAA